MSAAQLREKGKSHYFAHTFVNYTIGNQLARPISTILGLDDGGYDGDEDPYLLIYLSKLRVKSVCSNIN